MTFEHFKKRLDEIKKDYCNIESKTSELLKGVEVYVSDACGVPQSWLFDIVENELRNLMYAVNDKLIDEEYSVKDFIDYYLYDTSPFDGEISWEDEKGKHEFNLMNDEDTYKYILSGL